MGTQKTAIRFVLFMAYASSCVALGAACSRKVDEPAFGDFKPSPPAPDPPAPTKLEIVDEKVGTGAVAEAGKKLKVHYRGTLLNGQEFDSSIGKDPFSLKLGAGEVIKGWDQGLVGMKVGGKRKLTIPYDLAYGEAGSPPKIPPKTALKFDIELLGVE